MRTPREFSVGLALIMLESTEEEALKPEKMKPIVKEFSDVLQTAFLQDFHHSKILSML